MHRPSTKHKLGGLQSADAHQISVPTEFQRVYTLVTNSPHSLQPPSTDNLQRNPPPTPTPYSLCGGESRTSQASQPSLNCPPQSKSHTTIDSDDCERITLPNLMSKFSFPLCVQVVKGFVGKRGEESAIACGEVYNIHFVKHTEVVTMIDYNGNTYNVPLNSAVRSGIIYRS